MASPRIDAWRGRAPRTVVTSGRFVARGTTHMGAAGIRWAPRWRRSAEAAGDPSSRALILLLLARK